MRRWALAVVVVALAILAGRATSEEPPAPAARPSAPLVFRRDRPPAVGVRLEGRVVDEADRAVEGAIVTVGEQHATTDADGTFTIDALPGHHEVSARTEDSYAPSMPIEPSEPAVLRLIRGATVTVTVLADDPLAGAEVRIDADHVATTGADGIARLRGIARGYYRIDASAPGYALETTRIEIAEDPSIEQTLHLRRGAAAAGVVVDEAGKPVADATLDIVRLADAQSANATSDATGRWRVDAVAAGRYHISAQATGWGPTVAAPIELDGTTPRDEIVVRVARGGTLAGVVVDTRGVPQAGIEIELQQSARVDHFSTTSDPNGRYELSGVPAGVYFVMRVVGRVMPIDEDVMIDDGRRTEHTIVIDDDHVAGTVVDPAGAPVRGVWVIGDRDDARAVTDARGHFALTLRKGYPHEVDVRRRFDEDAAVRVEGASDNMRIVLPAAAAVTGRVMLDGKPLGSYVVRVTTPHVVRAADGRFALTDVQAGTVHIEVAAEGCDAAGADVAVAAGAPADAGDIVLHRAARITGRVVDARGLGVAGAQVTNGYLRDPVQAVFDGSETTMTDASGAFAIRRARSLRAVHPQLGVVEHDVPADATTIELVLEPIGGIDGIVEGFRGDQTYLYVRRDGKSFGSFEIDRAGEFHMDRLPAGTYSIEQAVFGASPRIRNFTATVVAGQRTRVRAMIEPNMVTVFAHVEAQMCEHQVSISGADEYERSIPCSGAPAAVPFLVPGEYRACDHKSRCTTITVAPAPSTQEITIQLPP